MKDLFLPYELAVIAKEKGFDEPCLGRYIYDEFNFEWYLVQTQQMKPASIAFMLDKNNANYNYVAAPLYQKIVDWFREKHDIHILIDSNPNKVEDRKRHWYFSFLYLTTNVPIINEDVYDKYYDALNKSIQEAFKLIK